MTSFHAGDDRQQHGQLDENVIFIIDVGLGHRWPERERRNSWESKIFEQVNGGENDDPDDIDEVPVKPHRLDIDGIMIVEIHRAA